VSIRLTRLLNMELSGKLSPELGKLSLMAILLLSGDQLSESLPDELGNCSNLEILNLDDNNNI
ncbi:hypothetical protein CUMW_001800, partial [Citrus unshiu]